MSLRITIMRNVINSTGVQQIVFRNYTCMLLAQANATTGDLTLADTRLVKGRIAMGPVTNKAFPLILQDPIKNIISYPE